MSGQVGWRGEFRATGEDGKEAVFPNSITPAGVQRVLSLMAGQSAQSWSAIRLVGANPALDFIQKPATVSVNTGHIESKAVFTASELTFAATSAQMYSGTTMVASASVSIPANQTVYVARRDYLETN